MHTPCKHNSRFVIAALAVGLFVLVTGTPAQKKLHITGTAMGTSTQLGRVVTVEIRINERSTPADQKVLLDAFAAGGSEGLANALDKMGSKGRASLTGTVGFDLNYIREISMPDGSKKYRFITDRPIAIGEAWHDTRSRDYSLAMGEITISKNKGKSIGTLMPIARFRLNKEKEIEIETFQNPWNLTNIRVW